MQKCESCGFIFINPRPDNKEIDRYYQSNDYISHDAKGANLISQIYKYCKECDVCKVSKSDHEVCHACAERYVNPVEFSYHHEICLV